jgi:hypothetical protein
MSIALSIDLDYWCPYCYDFLETEQWRNYHSALQELQKDPEDVLGQLVYYCEDVNRSPSAERKREINRTVDRVVELPEKVPVTVVMQHHHVLPYLIQADKLINLDAHDDLVTRECKMLGEGSWVSFVPWRASATYRWVYRSRYHAIDEGKGVCGAHFCDNLGGSNIWERYRHGTNHTDWKALAYSNVAGIKWDEVTSVVVSASPGYTYPLFGLTALKALKCRKNIQIVHEVKDLERFWIHLIGYGLYSEL